MAYRQIPVVLPGNELEDFYILNFAPAIRRESIDYQCPSLWNTRMTAAYMG